MALLRNHLESSDENRNLLLRAISGSDDRICCRVLFPGGISGKLPKWFSQKRISAAVGDAAGYCTPMIVTNAAMPASAAGSCARVIQSQRWISRKSRGMRIPARTRIPPCPVIPFFPFSMIRPEAAIRIRARAYRSENQVHSFLGLL